MKKRLNYKDFKLSIEEYGHEMPSDWNGNTLSMEETNTAALIGILIHLRQINQRIQCAEFLSIPRRLAAIEKKLGAKKRRKPKGAAK